MISALISVLIGVASAQAPDAVKDVFACSYVKDEKSDPDSHIVDLRAERRGTPSDDIWLLNFANAPTVRGKTFDASFGSIGGGTGIEWRDNNETHRAFVSYSDVIDPDGQRMMFLSVDKPSLWQPPGYICRTAALKENR